MGDSQNLPTVVSCDPVHVRSMYQFGLPGKTLRRLHRRRASFLTGRVSFYSGVACHCRRSRQLSRWRWRRRSQPPTSRRSVQSPSPPPPRTAQLHASNSPSRPRPAVNKFWTAHKISKQMNCCCNCSYFWLIVYFSPKGCVNSNPLASSGLWHEIHATSLRGMCTSD